MNVEQRLIDALRSADRIEPSPDLWSRVLHSIEEDRVHRRRIALSISITVGTISALVAAGWLGLADRSTGRQVDLRLMELLEWIALVALVAVLGPAIRRFGRGYAHDLWPATPSTASVLLRLLDVAYVLVFAGYILMSSEFDFGASVVGVAEQVEQALQRIGGLLLIMGLLHAVTIMALPLVALVFNSTRVGRSLPRSVVILLVVAGLGVSVWMVPALLGLLLGER